MIAHVRIGPTEKAIIFVINSLRIADMYIQGTPYGSLMTFYITEMMV